MPISAEDRTAAEKAYGEMELRDSSRVFSIMFGGLLFIPAALSVLFHQGPLDVWETLVSVGRTGGALWMFLLMQLVAYWRFQTRYAANAKIVSELERRYAGELPYGLEREVRSEPRKKALLWKLDAFLSRKKAEV